MVAAEVTDPFAPFLIPSPVVDYDEASTVVQVAQELYTASDSDAAFIEAAFRWTRSAAGYDESIAETADSIHQPDLERVIEEGKAICSDYASLFAALLRFCGVPCQVVYG